MKKTVLIFLITFLSLISYPQQIPSEDDGRPQCTTYPIPAHWGWIYTGSVSIPWYFPENTITICNEE